MENEEKQNGSEPHVKVFNEEVKKGDLHFHHRHDHDHNHHHHGGGGWLFGLVVLVIGALLLLNNLGIVSSDVWRHFWQFFWPVLLILIGIRIIIR